MTHHRATGLGVLLIALVALMSPSLVHAQESSDRTTTVVFVYEAGSTPAQGAIVSMGLRRGIRDVPGVRFLHPVDQLMRLPYDEEVEMALQELESVADMVRTGDAVYAYQRADELVEIFERNLLRVRRAQLVDAYMLSAVGRCRAGHRRQCQNRMRQVIAFREGLEYDEERYGADARDVFNRVRLRTINGRRGTLIVETEPPGAEIYIDGRSFGPSPIRADGLLEGGHYVTIKDVNHLKQIRRIEVGANRETTEMVVLDPNPQAALIASDRVQEHLRAELGEPRAQRTIQSLGRTLRTSQVIVGVLRPAAGNQVHVQLYLYHMRTQLLQSQTQATLSLDEAGMERAAALATELYQGVDLEGGIEAPEDDTEIHGPQPEIYEQWWFWTLVVGGAAAVVVGIAAGILIPSQDGPADGFFRFEAQSPLP